MKRKRHGREGYGERPSKRALIHAPDLLPRYVGGAADMIVPRAIATLASLGLENKFVNHYVEDFLPCGTPPGSWFGCGFDGADHHMTPVSRGTGVSEREGNQITLGFLEVAGYIHDTGGDYTETSSLLGVDVVVAVVLDTQTNGSAHSFDSEMVFDTGPQGNVGVINPMRNMSYVTRFRVLKKKHLYLQPGIALSALTTPYGIVPRLAFKMRLRLPKILQTYYATSSGGDIVSITDNSLRFIARGSLGVTTYRLELRSRARFVG